MGMKFSSFYEVITKIDGVSHVKVVSEDDSLQEIHILASTSRAPKQIVRDIESALLAVFDYRIDRKIISVAQIDLGESKGIKRIKLDAISFETGDNNIDCSVKLNYEGEEYCSNKTAIKTALNRKKVVAKATIAAVEKILGQSYVFDIQDVIISTSRDTTFVSVVVNMVINENEETMVGAAVVKNDINEAVAKATLDAVNRRIQTKFD